MKKVVFFILVYFSKLEKSDHAFASKKAREVLEILYKDFCGGAMPEISKIKGKPYFPSEPEIHFSISHSKTHVLCGISHLPIGVDTQVHRKMKESTINAITTEDERNAFNFFDLWCLRESYFKLCGDGDLRNIRFSLESGRIISPKKEINFRLYPQIENSSTAVACLGGDFPSEIVGIS